MGGASLRLPAPPPRAPAPLRRCRARPSPRPTPSSSRSCGSGPRRGRDLVDEEAGALAGGEALRGLIGFSSDVRPREPNVKASDHLGTAAHRHPRSPMRRAHRRSLVHVGPHAGGTQVRPRPLEEPAGALIRPESGRPADGRRASRSRPVRPRCSPTHGGWVCYARAARLCLCGKSGFYTHVSNQELQRGGAGSPGPPPAAAKRGSGDPPAAVSEPVGTQPGQK